MRRLKMNCTQNWVLLEAFCLGKFKFSITAISLPHFELDVLLPTVNGIPTQEAGLLTLLVSAGEMLRT